MLRLALFALLTTALAPASASVWSRLDVLEKRVDNLARTSQRIDTLQAENSRLNGEIEELKHQLEQLQEQQREMYLDIERRLGGAADNAGVEEPPAEQEEAVADDVAATPPQQPDDTGEQQCQPGDQIEHAEGCATQFRGRGICNQLRQQPLGKTHMQAPENDT
jgi:TolA-binding protein